MGIVVYVIAALMFTVFILIMVGIIVLPVEGMALGVILIAYMCGIIGMTVLAGNLMKRYMDLLDEIRYDDDLHEFHLDLESEE